MYLWGPDMETAVMWQTESLVWTHPWDFLSLDLALCHITG